MVKEIDDLGPALIGQLGRLLDQSRHPGRWERRSSSSPRRQRELLPKPRKN
jgi:hypothetical protein